MSEQAPQGPWTVSRDTVRARPTAVPDERLPSHLPGCLGCGAENPGSPHLEMHAHEGGIRAYVTYDEGHQGAPGFVHGGAISTTFDDVLGTVPAAIGRAAVTGNLSVDFRSPALIGQTFEVDARIVSIDGRKLRIAGTMREGERVVAEANALFIEVPVSHWDAGGAAGIRQFLPHLRDAD